ncbi:DinB family protein, partial [Candidatus Bathyarchaeota archaeon]
MSERAEVIKAMTVIGLDRLDGLTKELDEELLDWRPEPEANSLRWILTHESYILHVVLPWVFRGRRGYRPEGWPDDYQGNPGYSLEKILADLRSGRESVLAEIGARTDEG